MDGWPLMANICMAYLLNLNALFYGLLAFMGYHALLSMAKDRQVLAYLPVREPHD